MFSLHIDTARTWRGGQNQVLLTVNGLRAIGHRAALVAHPDGELRRRAAEGLELIPIAPRTEMDLSAAWKLSRLVKRLAPDVIHAHDPHGVAMASLALSLGASAARAADAGAGRVAARRLSPEGQFVLALEVPPGRLLHRRVRSDSPDAGRRRRPGRAHGHGARRHRRRARAGRAAGQRARGVLAAASARRSSATSRRSCRTRDSAT